MTSPRERHAVVLGGHTGLLGQSLASALREAGWKCSCLGRKDLDIFDTAALGAFLDEKGCTHLFNTVAYTQVDKAEEEPDAAYRLNKTLPGALGRLARDRRITLVHYSTDFVFSGSKDSPYTVQDQPDPQSVYGASKLAGEKALESAMDEGLIIIRTSWLFGPGKMNFVRRMIELGREREELRVVHDQVGSPTYTVDLASNSLAIVENGGQGLFHLACSGQASWCELASEAISAAGLGCTVVPITTADYPTPARRPPYSVLDLSRFTEISGKTPRPWVQCLREYVFENLGHAEDS